MMISRAKHLWRITPQIGKRCLQMIEISKGGEPSAPLEEVDVLWRTAEGYWPYAGRLACIASTNIRGSSWPSRRERVLARCALSNDNQLVLA